MGRSKNSGNGSMRYLRQGRGNPWYHRKEIRRARKAAKAALANGEEPPPGRHRPAPRWDFHWL